MVFGRLAKGAPSYGSPNFLNMVNTYLINTNFFLSNYMISSENIMAQEWTDWSCLHVLLEGRYWDASTSFPCFVGTWWWCGDGAATAWRCKCMVAPSMRKPLVKKPPSPCYCYGGRTAFIVKVSQQRIFVSRFWCKEITVMIRKTRTFSNLVWLHFTELWIYF